MNGAGGAEREAADPPPPVYRAQGLVPPDRKAVEGDREGMRAGTPKGPLGQMTVEGEGHRGSFGFLGRY